MYEMDVQAALDRLLNPGSAGGNEERVERESHHSVSQQCLPSPTRDEPPIHTSTSTLHAVPKGYKYHERKRQKESEHR